MVKKIIIVLAMVLLLSDVPVMYAAGIKLVDIPVKKDFAYPVDLMGNGEPYTLAVPVAGRQPGSFNLEISKNGIAENAYESISSGQIYIVKLRGNKEDIILLSNQGSGHFINAFTIIGYDGEEITNLFNLFESNQALSGTARFGRMRIQDGSLILLYSTGGFNDSVAEEHRMIIRPHDSGYTIADSY